MAAPTPERLRIGGHCLIVLRAVLQAAAPEEGCALLLGRRDGREWQLETCWPCRNVWPRPAQRGRRFAIDPREQLVAQQWGRSRGLAVLATAHSHPCSAAVPSRTDQRLGLKPALMLIADGTGEVAAWWLAEGSEPLAIPWQVIKPPADQEGGR